MISEGSAYFFRMIKNYFESYLPKQKAASKETIRSYKTTMNQFLDFASENLNINLSEFEFSLTSVELAESFLETGEQKQHWSITTRNNKLAAIRSFYKYAANHDIAVITHYQALMTIPEKNGTSKKEIEFFSESALKTLLEQPDLSSRKGIRNQVIMIVMYDTGGRIQEILDLKLNSIHLNENPAYVILNGKGGKTRLVPIMAKTVKHLTKYIELFHPDSNGEEYLFYTTHLNRHTQMSPDTVQKFIDKYCSTARELNKQVPEHIYCHMFRHSRAMHLYRNGMPLPLVSEWLGHAHINTTREFYANADVGMKGKAIEQATSKLNPLFKAGCKYDFEDDDELLKRLYGLK